MTGDIVDIEFTYGYFNSHPHEEDDYGTACNNGCGCYFNSHPHEEDD